MPNSDAEKRRQYQREYYYRVRKQSRSKSNAPYKSRIFQGVCHYCGRSGDMTTDHMVPRRLGGGGGENLKPCCMKCNMSKNGNSLEEWRVKLARRVLQIPHFSPAQREWLKDKFGRDPMDVDTSCVVFHFEGGPGFDIDMLTLSK